MANLLGDIKGRLGDMPTAATPQVGAQDDISKRIAGQLTGKAQTGTKGPRSSNVMERMGVEQGRQAIAGAQDQAKMAAGGLAQAEGQARSQFDQGMRQLEAQREQKTGEMATNWLMEQTKRQNMLDQSAAQLDANEEMKLDQINANSNKALAQLASDKGIQVDDIFSSFETSDKILADRKDALELEILAAALQLRDQQYVDKITRIGKQNELESDIAFRKEAQRLTFGEDLARMIENLNFNENIWADERALARELNKMDMDTHAFLADSAIKEANTQAVIQGLSGAAQAGMNYAMTPSSPTPSPMPGAGPTVDAAQSAQYGAGPTVAKADALAPNFDVTNQYGAGFNG